MTSRAAQRGRTREAVLAGARALIARGEAVTVAAAAAERDVSRATAYRYFSDPILLAVEAGLAIEVRTYEEVTGEARNLRARLVAITLYFFDLACEHEASFRQFLARNLDVSLSDGRPDGPLRGARRVAMLERALKGETPALPTAVRKRTIRALTVVTGVEAMVALLDVAGADRDEARRTVEELTELIVDRHVV